MGSGPTANYQLAFVASDVASAADERAGCTREDSAWPQLGCVLAAKMPVKLSFDLRWAFVSIAHVGCSPVGILQYQGNLIVKSSISRPNRAVLIPQADRYYLHFLLRHLTCMLQVTFNHRQHLAGQRLQVRILGVQTRHLEQPVCGFMICQTRPLHVLRVEGRTLRSLELCHCRFVLGIRLGRQGNTLAGRQRLYICQRLAVVIDHHLSELLHLLVLALLERELACLNFGDVGLRNFH